MSNQVSWLQGRDFDVCDRHGDWNHSAGIYIFTGLNDAGQWVPLYIGQCDSFCNRMSNHDRWEEAAGLGATHVHALVVPQVAARDAIEQTLIRHYQPTLNTQHR
jgi:hypothetical protein